MAKKEVDLRERLANDVLKIVETHETLIETIDEEDVEIKKLKRKRDRLLYDVDRLLYDVVKVEDKYGIGRGYLEGGTHFAEGSQKTTMKFRYFKRRNKK